MLLFVLTACGAMANHYNVAANPSDATEQVVQIDKGSTARGLGPVLAAAHVVDDAGDFTKYVRFSGEGSCIKAGKFRLRRSMTPHEILGALCGPPIPDDVPFTVVEGWRIREIDAALAEKKLIQPGAYAALAADGSRFHEADFAVPAGSLEGYLYPETYMVTPDRFDPATLIQRQLDLFAQRFATPHKAELTPERGLPAIVTMASMLEREEPDPQNRPLVAGILWKRLDHGWALGVDATSRYTIADWNDRDAFMKQLRDPDDPYNTRLRLGLPVTPIGNPNVDSLTAALHPVDSEFWYYLHDAQHKIHPSRTVAEHERFRKIYDVY